jgi:hypothetical protein
LDTVLPMGKLILPVLNFIVSVLLLAVTDVVTGALVTSVLFNVGVLSGATRLQFWSAGAA